MGSAIAAVALSAFMTGAGSTGSPAQAAIAPEERTGAIKTYHILASPMTGALNALADQNGLHLLYDARLTRGLRARGLSGHYSVRDALEKLLAGTGLAYRLSSSGSAVSIMLAENDIGTQTDAGAIALPAVEDTATQGDGAGTSSGEGGPGGPHDPAAYAVPNSTTATKTDTPIMQTSLSVQVVPQQVLQDQQVVVLDQALQNVSNVYTVANGGVQQCYVIRGFFYL